MKKRIISIMNTSKKRVEIAILCSILALSATLLSGSVFAVDPPEAEKDAEVIETIKSAIEEARGDTENKSPVIRAIDVALEKASGGIVLKYELDYEDGVKVYEFKIINGETIYEIDVCEDSSGKFVVCAYETEKAKKKDLELAANYDELRDSIILNIQFLEIHGELMRYEMSFSDGKIIHKTTEMDANGEKRYGVSSAGETMSEEVIPANNNAKKDTQKKETKLMPVLAISYDDAVAIIAEKLNDTAATVKEWELDSEKSVWKYEFEVVSGGKEYDIEINADTGEIIEFEIDD